MRPALLSLAVFLTYVWSSSDARGLPINRSLPSRTEDQESHVKPKYQNHLQPKYGGSSTGSSMGTFDYSSVDYSTGYTSDDSSMFYGTDDTQGTSDYGTTVIHCGNGMSSTSTEGSSSDTVTTEGSEVTTEGSEVTTTASESSCRCGVRNTVTRIVGGEEVALHEIPWQVAMVSIYGTRPYCGASIIADKWILTAAHCISSTTAQDTAVVIGEHIWNTNSETETTQRLKITKVIMHPDYNKDTMDNDIALLELKERIVFPADNKIAPICLPSPGTSYENVAATVSGWGTTSSGGSQPTTLNEVTVNTMTNTECKKTGYGDGEITANMICAAMGGKDSCQGDSGGPLVTDQNPDKSDELIGVVSWGYGCAHWMYPGVYTRVANYNSWIQAETQESWSTCPRA